MGPITGIGTLLFGAYKFAKTTGLTEKLKEAGEGILSDEIKRQIRKLPGVKELFYPSIEKAIK